MVKGGVRSLRLKNVKRSYGTVNDCDNADALKTVSTKEYQSAIARHLSLNSECAKAYCDGCFSILSCASSRRHLEVLESAYIHVQRPDLCVQKEAVKHLFLFKSHLAPVSMYSFVRFVFHLEVIVVTSSTFCIWYILSPSMCM